MFKLRSWHVDDAGCPPNLTGLPAAAPKPLRCPFLQSRLTDVAGRCAASLEDMRDHARHGPLAPAGSRTTED